VVQVSNTPSKTDKISRAVVASSCAVSNEPDVNDNLLAVAVMRAKRTVDRTGNKR
jgi:hypothetical protein